MAGGGSTWRAYALSLLAPALVVGGWWWMRARATPPVQLAAVTRAVPVEEGAPLEFAGCREVRTGPICTYRPDDEITLWVDVEAPADVEIRVDGATRAVDWTSVQGGLQAEVPLSMGAAELRVDRRDETKTRRSRLRLALAPDLSLVDEAKILRGEGKFDEALARIQPWLDDEDPYRRVAARALEARIIRQKGDPEEAIRRLRRLIEVDRELGLVSWETLDRFGLAFMIHAQTGRADHALDVVTPVEELIAQHPEGAARLPYYRGHFAAESGDVATALGDLRAAVRRSERLGMARIRISAQTQLVRLLQRLGRHDESAAHVAELTRAPGPRSPCSQARFQNNLADSILGVLRARPGLAKELPSPRPFVERAIQAWQTECKDERELGISLGTSAQIAIQAGDDAEASRILSRLKAIVRAPAPDLLSDVLLSEAGLDARAGAARKSMAKHRRLREIATSAGQPFTVWESWVAEGRLLRTLGRPLEALSAFESAEKTLEASLPRVPLGEGRGRFSSARAAGTSEYIHTLLSLKRVLEAADVARRALRRPHLLLDRARARTQLTTAERDRWNEGVTAYRAARRRLEGLTERHWSWDSAASSPGGQRLARLRQRALSTLNDALGRLPRLEGATVESDALPPGLVVLVLFPASPGWFVFALTSERADSALLPDLAAKDPGERAARIVDAVEDQISRSDEVLVVAHPGLGEVDFARALVRGRPLIMDRRLSHGLDLPRRLRSTQEARSRAVIVQGQADGFSAAEPEVELVRGWLKAQALVPDVLRSASPNSASALRSALESPTTRWLHYVGHAESRGIDGWESALVLGAGGRLTATDVLALDTVPPQVVLSGCETARTAGALRSPGLGLAQSFVLSGAQEVVATARPVEDRAALEFMRLLYARDAKRTGLAEMFHAAQKSAMLRRDLTDWSAFRLVTRSWRRTQP